MKIIETIKSMLGNIGLACSSFVLRYPKAYLATTALIGVLSLILFFAPEASAQLETQVTEALNPLARLAGRPSCQGTCYNRSLCVRGSSVRRPVDDGGVVSGCGCHSWTVGEYRDGDLSRL